MYYTDGIVATYNDDNGKEALGTTLTWMKLLNGTGTPTPGTTLNPCESIGPTSPLFIVMTIIIIIIHHYRKCHPSFIHAGEVPGVDLSLSAARVLQ